MKVRVIHNGDDTFVAWKPNGVIKNCRGFALYRKRNGVEEVVSTWVGFKGDVHTEGERRASTNWPIQKYQWTDYMAKPGDKVSYRVVPMVGLDKHNLQPATDKASAWTPVVKLGHEVSPGMVVYFNRGIVAAQWVARRLGTDNPTTMASKLETVIDTPKDPFRTYLYGPLGERLLKLLADAAKQKRHVYAALYELHDKELEAALAKIGKTHCHVVLANGSVKKKGEDQNSDARKALRNKIDMHHRMCSPRALGHNKYMVVCDANDKPRWVWTGSQNWTRTGLCTQANNAVLIDNPALAAEYKKQWNLLKGEGDGSSAALKKSNAKPRDSKIDKAPVRLWFTPMVGQADLAEARKVVLGAKQAILFLMFNPGPKDTLLNGIIAKARAKDPKGKLYIKGAINQDPSTKLNNVELFDQKNSDKADYNVVLPAAIDKATAYFVKELKKLPKSFAMVHSKVVLVDPFGANPVLMTGSHNLGPKASGTNDENFLIIRNAPEVCAAYASNIMSIYNQYRWRFRRPQKKENTGVAVRWAGLEDNDTWQSGYLKPGSPSLREIDFWAK